jgi:hypothetical protein
VAALKAAVPPGCPRPQELTGRVMAEGCGPYLTQLTRPHRAHEAGPHLSLSQRKGTIRTQASALSTDV